MDRFDAIRKMMELEMTVEEHRAEAEAKVYEAAGGYAPTVGIIGAVLGLIQVMKHLENIDEVGRGIAVAFVATVYGVAHEPFFCRRPQLRAHA
jgi:chemotaxis protein MotA